MVNPRVLPRAYPYADSFISAGRFLVSYPALIILTFGALNFCGIWELGAILFFAFLITSLGRRTSQPWSDSVALGVLYRKLSKQSDLKVFQPRDYFPEGLAIEVVREGRVIKPRYTILCMPGTRYQSVPYGPYASFVLVSAQPGRANPTQLYLLLHELGHIGYRNYITGFSSRVRRATGSICYRSGIAICKFHLLVDVYFNTSANFLGSSVNKRRDED